MRESKGHGAKPETGFSSGSKPQRPRSARQKRPTAWVQIPSAVLSPSDNLQACSTGCLACALAAEKPAHRIDADLVGKLCRGRGASLRVLLTIYRWARAYAGVPHGSEPDLRIFNAIERISMKRLAEEALGASGRMEQWTVGRSVSALVESGLVFKRTVSGKASIFVPHAIGNPVRVPQFLWRSGWLHRLDGSGRPVLDGRSLLLLVMLIARCHQQLDHVPGWRTTPESLKTLAQQGLILADDAALSNLPLSTRQRRLSLERLTDEGLVVRFRTRGTNYVCCLEPGR